jgi:hypothetical protein
MLNFHYVLKVALESSTVVLGVQVTQHKHFICFNCD